MDPAQDRSGAHEHGAVRAGGDHPPARDPAASRSCRSSMTKLLDQLAVPQDARDFAGCSRGGACVPGTGLPPPQGVFPRYRGGAPAARQAMLVDSHCHLDFPPTAPRTSTGIAGARARRRRRHDADDRHQAARLRRACARSPRPTTTSYCSVGVHPHEARERGRRRGEAGRARRITRRSSASARPGSTTTTTRARANSSARISAPICARRARPACR